MVILFEPHKFYSYLPNSKKAKALSVGLATKSYAETKASKYYNTHEKTADDRYKLFQRAIAYDRNAAFMSISSGFFQIMGFNHVTCGYTTAESMFYDFCNGPLPQVEAFILFLRSKGLVSALRKLDFERVEQGYNGGGQNGAYARKMREEYTKLVSTKWAGYKAGSVNPPAVEKPEVIKEVIVEKPIVPEGLDKTEIKSKTLWSSFLTLIGSPLAFWGGLPDYVKIGIVVVIVLGAALIAWERIHYAREARKLKGDYVVAAAKGVLDATLETAGVRGNSEGIV